MFDGKFVDGNKNLTVKERHRENFAYRLELLMGRHRENPEKLMINPLYFSLMEDDSSRDPQN